MLNKLAVNKLWPTKTLFYLPVLPMETVWLSEQGLYMEAEPGPNIYTKPKSDVSQHNWRSFYSKHWRWCDTEIPGHNSSYTYPNLH